MRWENSDPVYYGEILTSFKDTEGYAKPLSFEAQQLSLQIQNGKLRLREVEIHEETEILIVPDGRQWCRQINFAARAERNRSAFIGQGAYQWNRYS